MTHDGPTRREILLALAATPLTALASPIAAAGQPPGQARKVDTRASPPRSSSRAPWPATSPS
jgi:hypothetical protein